MAKPVKTLLTTTDEDGKCSFIYGYGSHKFYISKDGYDSQDIIITIDKNNPKTEIVLLKLFNLSFSITDGSSPIRKATVTIGEVIGTTGSAGGCTLSEIAEGEQTVTIKANGYITKTTSINVSESNTSFAIELESEE